MQKSYWDWQPMLQANATGFFPYTPATNLLYGLREALCMLQEEGLENVFARHHRLAEATRATVRAWGLEIVCANPEEYSDVLTGVLMPQGHDADAMACWSAKAASVPSTIPGRDSSATSR
jgi:alanine-glyoxylate transaminase/serine-glyoxylate transaminase/serine-pyruvate transaminase